MKNTRSTARRFMYLPIIALLGGCSGSSTLPSLPNGPAVQTQAFGPLVTRLVGAAQSPVTSSASNGYNVTALAGALIDQMTLNPNGSASTIGTKIFFHSPRINSSSDIYFMNPDGTGQIRITPSDSTHDFSGSLSPDEKKVLFSSNVNGVIGNQDLFTINPDGTALTNLTASSTANDFDGSWSPDGSKIAFTTNRDGNYEIYVMNADGSNPTRLTSNPASDTTPNWSPDGSKITFTTDRDGNNNVYTMNSDGSNPVRLTSNVASDIGGSWSPDGSKIAFVSYRDGNSEVYVMNADGSNQVNLTNNPAYDYGGVWSPDGSKIAFSTNRDGNDEIYLMNVDGTGLTRLTNNAYADAINSWSRHPASVAQTIIGTGGVLGTAAAGFLVGQKGDNVTSILSFDTPAASRSGARVVAQTSSETQGSNLVFVITTSAVLSSVRYASINESGFPGLAVNPTIPAGSTGALVSFNATTGKVSSVLPFAANRSAGITHTRNGNILTFTARFTAAFDDKGNNRAAHGARQVSIDASTGNVLEVQ